MTRDETRNLLRVVSALYPNWHPEEISLAVDAWWTVLSDLRFDAASAALKEYAGTDTSGFAPSPGKIIELAKEAELKIYWDGVSRAMIEADYRRLIGGE